jgi:hypothetical protein
MASSVSASFRLIYGFPKLLARVYSLCRAKENSNSGKPKREAETGKP